MTFKDLDLIPELIKAIAKQGYKVPTPIQKQSIPYLLEGKDLIGIAQTGTGKTAAFVLPILQRMKKEQYPRVVQTLVLAPTRELAAQIGESFSAYGEFLNFKHAVVFGGVSQVPQVNVIRRGVDIIVATPGRLLDLMNQGKIDLKHIEFFVLDEGDRMLDMGFIHDIRKIIARLPEKRQSLFFSATMSKDVNELAKRLLKYPVHVGIESQATTVDKVKQYIFFVDQESKSSLLLKLLQEKHLTKVLVFTSMKHRANKIATFLEDNRISSDSIHGNKSQNARTQALNDFKIGRIKVLVATDIAARGIDIDDISHVINFDLPNEPESYVHRIGRTARAGDEGTSYSFCSAEERTYLRDIEKLIKMELEVMDHEFHSERAKNAEGNDAKPLPRGSNRPRFNDRSRPNNHRPNFRHDNRSNDRFRGTRDSRRDDRRENSSRPSHSLDRRRESDRSGGRSGSSRSDVSDRPRRSSSRSFNSRTSGRSGFRRR